MDTHLNVMAKFNFKQTVRWVMVIAIFLFLARMVWENWSQVRNASFTLKPLPLILSSLIFGFSFFVQLWAWYLITLKLGIALSLRETLENWFYSQLGKYLPGKVWMILGRFYLYESKGKSKKLISTALYFEMVTIMVAGGLLFLFALFGFEETSFLFRGMQIGWGVLILLMAFLGLHPRILEKVINWVLIRFNREGIVLSITYLDVLWILFICVLSWLIGGVGFYLFVDSIYPISSKYFLFLTGGLAISSTLGLIAVFAPAGLGVREGTLVYLLTYVVPAPIAVILSVATRLWLTLIEIGLIGLVYFGGKFHNK